MSIKANELIDETSPYLLQHAYNPVDWMAWNDAAWAKAKRENKLVIVSIGYSACHWCHVMEHESFEKQEVAQLMNAHFVSIKVDREERPDVDQIYMDACQLINGNGGWPLNAITLPDGRPIFAGTYYPQEHWLQLLDYFVKYWNEKPEEAMQRATEITRGINNMDNFPVAKSTDFDSIDLEEQFRKIDLAWDYTFGGRMGAPKFPMPVTLELLLQNHFYTKASKPLEALTVTLDNMMNGGIYDHIGGGFARYSVDAEWEIPHFEKMLYDNAQLVSLYANAFKLTKNNRYKEVVYETIDFIAREWTDKSGGIYSASDADSEGEEGKFYVWSADELRSILDADFGLFCTVFNVSAQGNFEGQNNLTRVAAVQADNEKLKVWKTRLWQERSKRIAPGLDDKILTAWNALMLMGYVDAYTAFGEQRFLNGALRIAQFFTKNVIKTDFSLTRNFKHGKTTIAGFLDDYSFSCEAFIALYQATFDEQYLRMADGLAQYTIQHFYNAQSGLFFYTSVNDAPLIARKTETTDNVIPSSNASFCKALFKLGYILEQPSYLKIAQKAALAMKEQSTAYPAYYANWAMLNTWLKKSPFEVAIVGQNAEQLRQIFSCHYLPNALLLGASSVSDLPLLAEKYIKEETYIYVCANKACQLPVSTVDEALAQLM